MKYPQVKECFIHMLNRYQIKVMFLKNFFKARETITYNTEWKKQNRNLSSMNLIMYIGIYACLKDSKKTDQNGSTDLT